MTQIKTKQISLSLPIWVLENLENFAKSCDVPLETVIKMILVDWVQKERKIQAA